MSTPESQDVATPPLAGLTGSLSSEQTFPRAPLIELIPVFLIALAQAILLHWEMLSSVHRIHDNWRQAPHWMNKARTAFQPDDLIVKYSEFNTAPFENFLYQNLSRLGPDMLWGKITPLVFYAITAVVVYMTGYAMRGRIGGIVAAVVFMCFRCSFKNFVGGFSSGMSTPLLCLAVLFTFRKAWWAFVPLLLAEVLVYPMVAIHTGVLLIVDTLANDTRRLKDPSFWRDKMLPLVISAGIVVVAVGSKYVLADHGFGELVDRELIGNRPEFGYEGRGYLTPISSIFPHQLANYWSNPYHIALLSTAFIVLGRGMFRLPRGIWALFIASVALYLLADLMLLRLYYPNRYLHRSFPLVLALASATWMHGIRSRGTDPISSMHPFLRPFGGIPKWSVPAVLLVMLGSWTFSSKLIPPGGTQGTEFKRVDLYQAIRDLPGRPMIASPPRLSELSIFGGKTVLISRESAHPWWTEYWNVMRERHLDYFRGYFASDPELVRDMTLKHKIDYWIVDRRDFTTDKRRIPNYNYFQPFNDFVHDEIPTDAESLLINVPPILWVWSNKRFFIVPKDNLLAWLETQGSRR